MQWGRTTHSDSTSHYNHTKAHKEEELRVRRGGRALTTYISIASYAPSFKIMMMMMMIIIIIVIIIITIIMTILTILFEMIACMCVCPLPVEL